MKPASLTIGCAVAINVLSAGVSADTYDASWRYGTIGIPRLEQAPVVDGVVDSAEWGRATLFPPLLVMSPSPGAGLPPRERTWVWASYTSDALHFAFRQELLPEALPLEVTITNRRDACEGVDNTISVFLSTDEKVDSQFNFSVNAASQIYDRKVYPDDIHWDGNVVYESRLIPTGWEGELSIPFAELGLKSAPTDGTFWNYNLFSLRRKGESLLLSWPYTRWRAKGEVGKLVFTGNAPAVRFEQPGRVKLAGGEASVQTRLMHRTEKSKQSYFQQLADAILASQGEGATFESMEKMVGDALAPFEAVAAIDAPGEYLLRFDVKKGDQALAAGVAPFYRAAPIELQVNPFFLSAQKLFVDAEVQIENAVKVDAQLRPAGLEADAPIKARRAAIEFPTAKLANGDYELVVTAKDSKGAVVGATTKSVRKPPPPDWWTMKEGVEPRVPPPWRPVKASENKLSVLLREYAFDKLAVPARVTTRGKEILAGPMEFRAPQPWEKSTLRLVQKDDEAAVYESQSVTGNLKLKIQTRVEFDGFMYVDLELIGAGTLDKLDFVIPFKKEHAILLQNYQKAPGPGSFDRGGGNLANPKNPYQKGKRFVGFVPDEALQTPPMLTTWIGTDHYGLEWSCESSRGWSLAKPNQAMEVRRDGDRVLLTVHFISRPVELSNKKPRRIRFGLVATPTKTLLPYLAKARFYDDYFPYLLPATWGEYPVWHPPLKSPPLIEKNRKWLAACRQAGQKPLINGGWHVSTQDPGWDTWGREMAVEPLTNVSWANAKQFAACWKSPFGVFMANSFGYNARLLGFAGIRFDTVVPPYECRSRQHDCGWYDDDGKLWGSCNIFAQREAWKRLYRIFHGGVITNGCIMTPTAAGPIMAIHSFADHHEIGESYYMHARTLKEGYPPDMVRAIMPGEQYGFRAQNNLKGRPLFFNERIAALLVNGGEPRFTDYRAWKSGYEAQANPAVSIRDAWDWVDRWNAQFLGWWENGEYLHVEGPSAFATRQATADKLPNAELLASCWLNRRQSKVLVIVTNYETEPLDDVVVKLNLPKLGLAGQLYAEDAVTLEPVAITADGLMKVDVLGQRYRLIKISPEPPTYREEVLGPNLVATAPPTVTGAWSSEAINLHPNATYVLSAEVRITKPIGADSSDPNRTGHVPHYLSIELAGDGINGVNATNTVALCRIHDTDRWIPYRETLYYRQSYLPKLWEKTPGWTTLFVPFGTSTNTSTGKVVVTLTDPDQAEVRNIALRKRN